MDRWLAVISDLHIGEGVLDDFDQELEGHLVEYLDWLGDRPEPVELVINGDFLDFAQASPWSGGDLEDTTAQGIPLCFTEPQSVGKLTAIQSAHPKIFAALNAFLLRRDENRLVILPGNHDVDFFWPQVRKQFAAVVDPNFKSQQLYFCLDRAYRPAGYSWLWIEHGHQHDQVNSFFAGGEQRWNSDNPPIFSASDGTPRLLECTGTRFMIRYLNGLDARYPYVDNVKPFSRFIRIFGASALAPGRGPLDAAVAVTKMLTYVAGTIVTRPGDLLGVETEDGATLPHALIAWIDQASDGDRKRLTSALRERGFRLPMPLDMLLNRPDDMARLVDFLAANLDLLEGLGEKNDALLGDNAGTLALKRGFNANETEDVYQGAVRVACEGVTTVVMGHTHEPIERKTHFSYFNTGSWTRYYRFAKDEATAAWTILRDRSYERFPYQLRYMLVRPSDTAATMEIWRERFRA
jgi:UDP-2,3-diacylglucosamine pyrophosphatase LpxH